MLSIRQARAGVDDYSTMVRIIRNLLRQIGLPMSTTARGARKMHAKRYGLVISDWNMEPMTGFDLLRQVRADPDRATPFIMVTAESKTENVIAARKAGVNNYIVKPFNAQTLKAKIEAVFARKPPKPSASRVIATGPHHASRHVAAAANAGAGEHRIQADRSARRGRRIPRRGCRKRRTGNRAEPAAPFRSVRIESPIASTRAAAGRRREVRPCRAPPVNRRVRLAAIKHLAADRRISVRQRAGAIDQFVAALDDDVGIGADHEQRARAHCRQQLAIVFRRFAGVVEQPGTHRVVGGLGRRKGDIEPGEDRKIALRSEMKYAFTRS